MRVVESQMMDNKRQVPNAGKSQCDESHNLPKRRHQMHNLCESNLSTFNNRILRTQRQYCRSVCGRNSLVSNNPVDRITRRE